MPIMEQDGTEENAFDNDDAICIDAEEVFVLMTKNTRVSRNIRACWFFRNLKSTVRFRPLQELQLEDLRQDLTLAALIPADGEPMLDPNQTYNVGISPTTTVTFLASRYRIAFTLDLSPSVMAVDAIQGRLICEEVFQNFCKCLQGLVKPFHLPGSQILFVPKIFITVLAYTPLVFSSANQVMVQGVSVSQDNVNHVIQYVRDHLVIFKNTLSGSFVKLLENMNTRRAEHQTVREEEEAGYGHKIKEEMLGSPEVGFVDMLRCGILALQMLPDNSSSGIVIITDGLVGVPDANFLESLLMQLRNTTISCTFLKASSCLGVQQQLGHIPYVELMRFIATATFGGYFATCPSVADVDSLEPNVYHQALFYWSFQKGLEGFSYRDVNDDPDVIGSPSWVQKQLYSHPLRGRTYGLDLLRKKHQERLVQVGLSGVLSVRLREGYTIREVHFLKGGSEIEVKLVLPWRDYGKVEYNATAAWPLEKNRAPTKVEIYLEGSYDFLHEITCNRGRKVNSLYRTVSTKKFWHLLQNISQTDQLLMHLQSFDSNPAYYEIPNSIRSGVPLFVLDPVHPVLNSQLTTREPSLAQFASFWRPVLMLDANIWQKWVHSHRIGLVLEQDLPLPRYLHVPNSSGRFNILQCRQALASLTQHLRDWATFVLAENHSYIKLLYKQTDKAPSFFCMLRLIAKPPSVILRLAFLGGTPSSMRRQEVQMLKEELAELKFPQRNTQKSDKKPALKLPAGTPKEKERKAPLLREWSEINCCTLLQKPVNKILIRYEEKPEDISTMHDRSQPALNGDAIASGGQPAMGMRPVHSKFNTLSHYLLHRRWVWSVQLAACVPVSLSTIGKMLQTLTKIRLQEGFHFAAANSGISNMVLEVDMVDNSFVGRHPESSCIEHSEDEHQTCVLQYIVFPPHNKTSLESVSEEDGDEMETTEADGEVQIVTECWIEPQFGVCVNNTPERLHFEGLTAEELAKAFFPVDYECISSLTTFNHLIFLCQRGSTEANLVPEIAQSGQTSPPSTPKWRHGQTEDDARLQESTISFIPFPFDLLTLLPRCQQAELIFSTYSLARGKSAEQDSDIDPKGSNELLFSLLYDKFKEIHHQEVFLTSDKCAKFANLLAKRARDLSTHPFPFNHSGFVPEQADKRQQQMPDDRQETDGGDTTDAGGADIAGDRVKSVMAGKETSLPANTLPGQQLKNSTGKVPQLQSTSGPSGIGPLNQNQPMWRCFVKAVSSFQMILTFLPASYDDLLLLNASNVQEEGLADNSCSVGGNDGDAVIADVGESASGWSGEADDQSSRGASARHEEVDISQTNTGDLDSFRAAISSPLQTACDDTYSLTTADMSGGEAVWSVGDRNTSAVITITKASPGQSPERIIPHCREEDIKEWVKTSSPAVQPQVKGPLLIPIYVYDCFYHSVIESLVNRWTFTVPPDIYEDLSFVSETGDKHHVPTFMNDQQTSFTVSENMVGEKDGDFSRSNGRMSLDRRSNDSNNDGFSDFRRHVQIVSEAFFNCFVTGLYQSLHNHFFVDKSDIEAAIGSIGEETLEIDMTTFLLASCSHMQHLASQVCRKMAAAQDGDLGPSRHSVRFMEILEIESNDGDMVVPEVLQLPYGMVPLLPSVFADSTCEHTPGLHQLVQGKFLEIVCCWFQPVPTLPDYYFYCPELPQHNSLGDLSGSINYKGDTSDGNLDRHLTETEVSTKAGVDEDDGDIIIAEFYNQEGKTGKDDMSAASNLDDSISDIELNLTRGQDDTHSVPLFVHFTCTLKRRTQHHNISVTSLPQCLGGILSCFEEPLLAVDLGEIKITLDINCLSLPVEPGQTDTGRSSQLQIYSNQSHSRSSKSSDSDNEDLHSTSASDCGDYLGDPISHLPRVQREAVVKFKSEVEWLLQDEVASALRHLQPLNADALEFVMQHVMSPSSLRRPSIAHQEISLLFVYGTQRSMQLFVEEFERISIPGYRLNKLKGYYYLAIDRAHADSIRHAQALKTALAELSLADAVCEEDGARLNADGRKLFPTMEERSYSLPSILPSAQPNSASLLPTAGGGTVCAVGVTGAPANDSSDDNRPRSSSDAKFFKQRNQNVVTYFGDGNSQSAAGRDTAANNKSGIDPSLHKSNSFGGLQEPTVAILPPTVTSFETQPETLSKTGSSPSASVPGTRSRHFSAPSGQGTPQSHASTLPQTPSVASSHGSATSDAGFEGDVSDADVDDTVSVSDAGVSFPRLPPFWLIMQIHNNRVELFFQTRRQGNEESGTKMQKSLLRRTSKSVEDICQKINKQLLLNELYETRMCNSLLVPAADEDVQWTDRRTISGRSMPDASELDEEDESEESKDHGYLEAALNFEPGYFACDCMWRKLFVLHPRLKAGTQRTGPSRGLLALRSVLNKFSVNNRSNMFVIQEASSRNVFYLRLKEISLAGLNESIDIQADLEASMSDFSIQTLKPESKLESDTKSEGDTVSVLSGFSRLSSRMEDMVELTAHGIEEPGKEIREDLMKLLQNRLDDTVLDVISLMLSRNPQCKLRPEDVQFIQNMEQESTETLRLTIPSHAMQYLSALIFYLRQNLLQFLHAPNYMEESPDCHFQDIVEGKRRSIPSDQVYLYISPQSGGRKGIACVSCSLVDGCGNPVKLLGCPRPSSLSTVGLHTADNLPQMAETSVHTASTTSWGPGPTALIQFRIWQRGSLDLRQLRERLTSSACHALCDVVMEFFLLTAPTCSLPSGLQDLRTLPVASLPSSPVTQKKATERKQPDLGRKLSDSAGSLSMRPVPHSASPFQTLRETFSPRMHIASPNLESSQSFDWSQVQAMSTPGLEGSAHRNTYGAVTEHDRGELQELVVQYERGEKGTLHHVFSCLMEPWLRFCHKRGLPSVSKVELSLQAEFSVEYILHELLASVPTISATIALSLFKVLHYSDPHQAPISIHYSPCRPQQTTLENQMECVIDRSDVGNVKLLAVGRDYDQWSSTVERDIGELTQASPAFCSTTTKSIHGSQKFTSFWQEGSKEKTKGGVKQAFIPRQHLLFITAYDKKLTVYMYNWAGDQGAVLEKTVRRLVQWHNARAHILASIISQKMGLFHHNMFDELSHTVEQNPYTQTSNDLDSLVRHTAPPRDVQRRHSSLSTQSRSFSHVLNQTRPFDQTYSNLQPVRPLQRSAYGSLQDPVSCHGMQVLEIRSRFRKDAERLMKLRQLYGLWWQKTSPNTPVTEDYLAMLKKSSRLFHYCATPLLFCQQWRQRVLEQTAATTDIPLPTPPPPPPSPEKEPPKSRSRHSSGTLASNSRRKRSLSQDAGRGKRVEPSSASLVEGLLQKTTGPGPEDLWHRELCFSFMMQYCNYLTTEFGFVRLNLQPGLPKKGSGHTSSQNSASDSERSQQRLTVSLQKTLTAGIILIELSLHSQYFFLKMFVFDCLHTLGINPNQQMKLLFVEECEKYRDLIHVHSFAHDFHLRCVHHFLSVDSSIFHPGFHLSNFLGDFLQIYPVPPTFSRNCLAQETMQIQDLPCPGPQLFNYMHNQIRQFSMTVLRMTPLDPVVEPDYCYIKGDEFALVQTCILQPSQQNDRVNVEEDQEIYNMAVIITHDTKHSLPSQETDHMMLRIKFFVVLTRQHDCHPKRTLEKKFGDFRLHIHQSSVGCSGGVVTGSSDSDLGAAVAVKQHLGVRQEHINYLGYINVHQAYLYTLLNSQIQAGRDKVQEMVELSKVKCRRDYLWHRMASAVLREEVKKKGKQAEETLDPGLIPLSFAEFGELLDLVCLQPLPEVDNHLMLFAHMPSVWYSSLLPVLITRFPTNYRSFTSPDGFMQHVVILNRNWLDMCILLTIDRNTGCTALCSVTREPCAESQEREESPSLLQRQMYALIEDFVSSCCFHLWTTVL